MNHWPWRFINRQSWCCLQWSRKKRALPRALKGEQMLEQHQSGCLWRWWRHKTCTVIECDKIQTEEQTLDSKVILIRHSPHSTEHSLLISWHPVIHIIQNYSRKSTDIFLICLYTVQECTRLFGPRKRVGGYLLHLRLQIQYFCFAFCAKHLTVMMSWWRWVHEDERFISKPKQFSCW